MRNWALRRKGGGAENWLAVRSVAVATGGTVGSVAIAAVAANGAVPICGEGLDATVTLLSRLVLGLAIEQLSAQHDIEACIGPSLMPVFPRQQEVAAGSAVTNKTSETAIAVASFVIDLFSGCTTR